MSNVSIGIGVSFIGCVQLRRALFAYQLMIQGWPTLKANLCEAIGSPWCGHDRILQFKSIKSIHFLGQPIECKFEEL